MVLLMIMPITNPDVVDKLLPLVMKIDDLIYSPHGYLNYMKAAIQTESAVLFVNLEEDGKMDAFLFAESIMSITDREVMIDLAYGDPKTTIGKEMFVMIEKWARMRGCKRIGAITRPPKARAMMRKYGFNQNWSYLLKDLKEEGNSDER